MLDTGLSDTMLVIQHLEPTATGRAIKERTVYWEMSGPSLPAPSLSFKATGVSPVKKRKTHAPKRAAGGRAHVEPGRCTWGARHSPTRLQTMVEAVE